MKSSLRLFFIVNKQSGNHDINFIEAINTYFNEKLHISELYILTKACSIDDLSTAIKAFAPDRVVAVGGDGTVRLAAQCLLHSAIPLAIVPGGSANGMAKEIGLKNNVEKAFETAINGIPKSIHAISINNQLSIHLADTGLNARIIKKFQSINERGMLGYAKALWRALKKHKRMHVAITAAGKLKRQKAEMVVIANGTMYGTGVQINKRGSLFDDHFEVVVVKWFSLFELLKMYFRFKTPLNPFKTEVIEADQVSIDIKEHTFFQIDGEYMGKVNHIEANLIPNALQLIVPDDRS